MKYTDIMIDLETLGTAPGSVITQIGMCAFSPRDGNPNVESTFIRIDPQSALDCGLTVSWATISWWLQQDHDARMKMAGKEGALELWQALKQMNEWIVDKGDERVQVWGNGSNFDIGLLEVALAKVGQKPAWHFRNIRDQRTITHLDVLHDDLQLNWASPLVAHDAREDAIAQAQNVRMCIRKLEGLGRGRP